MKSTEVLEKKKNDSKRPCKNSMRIPCSKYVINPSIAIDAVPMRFLCYLGLSVAFFRRGGRFDLTVKTLCSLKKLRLTFFLSQVSGLCKNEGVIKLLPRSTSRAGTSLTRSSWGGHAHAGQWFYRTCDTAFYSCTVSRTEFPGLFW